ncbi:MAG TPA: glycosyltransferase [Bacteroidales bacterium]|nr:glycosyltransferase [Bacteroidales bacterium]
MKNIFSDIFTKSSSKRHLHVIAFDIPMPANYGGAIDIFYKLEALKEEGIKIHLHCFEYDRKPSPKLNDLCETVNYYKRIISKKYLFKRRPYIVVTRASEELLSNLTYDNYPILFEGLHTCYYLSHDKLRKRRKIVRTHNIEHEYYSNLAKVEKNIFKKYYFLNEASKLRRYENVLEHASGIACISHHDKMYFHKRYKNVVTVSAFHPYNRVISNPGIGSYALYHGSLEVGENNQAALYLVNKVFNDIKIPLIIAGNKPSKELIEAVSTRSNIELRTKLSTEEIYSLIENAQVNILPTFQSTGIKLKLLAALYRGRHCLVNTPMVYKTELESLCTIADTPEEMKQKLFELMKEPFTIADIERRQDWLNTKGFSNKHNVRQLIRMLFH